MSEHVEVNLDPADSRRLEGLAWPTFIISLSVGIAGLLLALIVSLIYQAMGGHGLRRFGFAYLTNYAFFLSLALGAMCFVLATHLFRAGWVVLVRRIPEILAANMPTMAILFIPILIYIAVNNGMLYAWAQPLPEEGHGHETAAAVEPGAVKADPAPEHQATVAMTANADKASHGGDLLAKDAPHSAHAKAQQALAVDQAAAAAHEDQFPTMDYRSNNEVKGSRVDDELIEKTHNKNKYLNIPFFIARWVFYLFVWSAIGLWYWRSSTRQDLTGDAHLTMRMEALSGPLAVLFGITVTFAAFDLLMSLDPTWYSTMFGIYYFAGSMQGTMAALILLILLLQKLGFLPSVTIEHYHDLGKLLYTFVIFWAYVAFAQYMLIWYSDVPGEQAWAIARGMSTNHAHGSPWQFFALAMFFGRFLIPFFGFMSRWPKRDKKQLLFWAAWLLVFQWLDMYWMVMPEFDAAHLYIPVVEILCLIGLGGIFLAAAVRLAARHSLVSVGDPRLEESLTFKNF